MLTNREQIKLFMATGNYLDLFPEKSDNPKYNKELYERMHTPVNKIITPGRNEACPCGSGKKYKNCCGKP